MLSQQAADVGILGTFTFAIIIPSCSFTFASIIPSCSLPFLRVIPTLLVFLLNIFYFTCNYILYIVNKVFVIKEIMINMQQEHYHCQSAMICRDDLELRWRLLMCENEFSHILYCVETFLLRQSARIRKPHSNFESKNHLETTKL